MDATLKLISDTLAYGDVGTTSNPLRRYVDWAVSRSYSVRNPKAEGIAVEPGASYTLFSGTRSTSIDGTTEFNLSLSTLASTRYRFTWSGVGTNPVFRTDRALTLNTVLVTIVVNTNQTITMTGVGGSFSAVQVGDVVFLPGPTTGDAATVFNAVNEGLWTVLSVAVGGASMQLSRPSGQTFAAVADSVTVTSNTQVQAFSAAGVQVGDSVNISAGFSTAVQGTYSIVAVTPKSFDVVSTKALPVSATAIPGAAGMLFFSAAKRYVRIEADQECVVRLNGDSGNSNPLVPWAPADPENTAFFEKVGPCWSAVVVNKASVTLNLLFISAE